MDDILSYEDILNVLREEPRLHITQILWAMLRVQVKYAEETTAALDRIVCELETPKTTPRSTSDMRGMHG